MLMAERPVYGPSSGAKLNLAKPTFHPIHFTQANAVLSAELKSAACLLSMVHPGMKARFWKIAFRRAAATYALVVTAGCRCRRAPDAAPGGSQVPLHPRV